jgi:3-phenylpropionate/trans-cinnamate dioxygenase ferredoxin reductase subunit
MPDEAPGIVIIGASIAGLTAVQELRRGGYTGPITVADRDPRAPYRRPDVSKALLLDAPGERTLLAFDAALDVTLMSPAAATRADFKARTVTIANADGAMQDHPYNKLIIATGAEARSLPLEHSSMRVHTLRSITDAERFRIGLKDAATVTIIGGGLIGLEVAAGLAGQGKNVVVIEMEPKPLQRVLGGDVSACLVEMLKQRGVKFHLGTHVTAIDGVGTEPASVTVPDGTTFPSDLILISVGAQPATGWLTSTGLSLDDGISCDENGRVKGTTDVYALGDAANWPNRTLGRRTRTEHWNNAIEHAVHAAKHILDADTGDGFRSVPYFWSDQADLKLQVLGSTLGHDDVTIVRADEKSLLAEYRDRGRLIAVAGINAGRDVMTRRGELVAAFADTENSAASAG